MNDNVEVVDNTIAEDIAKLEKKFSTSRINFLVMIILSILNVFLYLINSNVTFLFSALVPQIAVEMGSLLDDLMWNPNGSFIIIGIVAAFLAIGLFVVCYILSKTKKEFILVALILFILDSVFMVGIIIFAIAGESRIVDLIFDILFHIWVLYCLINGVRAWYGLKKLPLIESALPEDVAVGEPIIKKYKIYFSKHFGKIAVPMIGAYVLVIATVVVMMTGLLFDGSETQTDVEYWGFFQIGEVTVRVPSARILENSVERFGGVLGHIVTQYESSTATVSVVVTHMIQPDNPFVQRSVAMTGMVRERYFTLQIVEELDAVLGETEGIMHGIPYYEVTGIYQGNLLRVRSFAIEYEAFHIEIHIGCESNWSLTDQFFDSIIIGAK